MKRIVYLTFLACLFKLLGTTINNLELQCNQIVESSINNTCLYRLICNGTFKLPKEINETELYIDINQDGSEKPKCQMPTKSCSSIPTSEICYCSPTSATNMFFFFLNLNFTEKIQGEIEVYFYNAFKKISGTFIIPDINDNSQTKPTTFSSETTEMTSQTKPTTFSSETTEITNKESNFRLLPTMLLVCSILIAAMVLCVYWIPKRFTDKNEHKAIHNNLEVDENDDTTDLQNESKNLETNAQRVICQASSHSNPDDSALNPDVHACNPEDLVLDQRKSKKVYHDYFSEDSEDISNCPADTLLDNVYLKIPHPEL